MKVENHVSLEYPRVDPFEGVNAIEKSLIENKFMVVSDEETDYYGILSLSDVLTKPHKLVIDCLTEKPRVDSEQELTSVFDYMTSKKYAVLPVFKEESFIGVISIDRVAQVVKEYTERLSNIIVEDKTIIDNIKKEAQVSERLKESFLLNINHEIRTPLTGLVGFSALLTTDGKTEQEKADYCEIIERSSDRLLNVMENIISLSRIQAGDRSVTTVNKGTIGELIRELYLYYKEDKKKLSKDHLYFKCDYHIIDNKIYSLDFLKIKQILGYLLDNAFKFTDDGGIEIGCMPVIDNELKFYVKDTGIGISPQREEYIFKAFNKVSANVEHYQEGLGLGLSIAQNLAHSLDGKITVESEVGKGSCFTLIVPVIT